MIILKQTKDLTMTYLGEMISIGVAFSWTATALLSEFGSKRMGNT